MNKWGLMVLTILVAAGVSIASFKIMEHNFHPVPVKDKTGRIRFVPESSVPDSAAAIYPDLTQAAAMASRQVVHIKVKLTAQNSAESSVIPGYYGAPQQPVPVMASGSGVILSPDGYIITNNHVVEDAAQMEVVLTDKRTFPAKLIGRDPNTDLALIKISASGLSAVKLGNSDNVQIGQWVLAIGYPFSLNTTVTAGIVSAKERSIGIIGNHERERSDESSSIATNSAIEAYIQTDAAINPGNSGGALVNTQGELIGINAAIASQTGGYEGYGFAIPVNLARKIVDDLRKYGTVKRGYLGVVFPSPSTETQELSQRGIDPGSIQGVYITGVQEGSAAAAAGLKEGDVIQQIDGHEVNSSVEFSERIARHHPQDKVSLKYLRNGKINEATATLKAQSSAAPVTATGPSINDIYNKLGARFAPLTEQLKQRFQVSSGMLVTAIARGGFFEQIGIQPGSIIVSVNGVQVNNPLVLNKTLTAATSGTVRIACITPDGSRVMFNLSLGT
ncbi:PDZ domain-containing protein [Mucilaginibacter robiniae]|uniref:PDZ domain-containing protein n=1 Tax=Mucilaginibacter robiniae TaxID=2728022 RepID=A0A7L5E0C3_9SPHI|nr:trypsin-like peptidase domain-containing protein [Mucilaginibacter robiniae]QJD95739.1 PDZ domain-containing protein [Mucilaginibacter robiniae]